MNSAIKVQLDAMVEARLEGYAKLPLQDIKDLPQCRFSDERIDQSKVTLTVFHDTESNEDKIVVQALCPRWLGLSTAISAAGIAIAGDGLIRRLSDRELWDFS